MTAILAGTNIMTAVSAISSPGITFDQFLEKRIGPNYVVVTRVTARVKERYPDAVHIRLREWRNLKREYQVMIERRAQ